MFIFCFYGYCCLFWGEVPGLISKETSLEMEGNSSPHPGTPRDVIGERVCSAQCGTGRDIFLADLGLNLTHSAVFFFFFFKRIHVQLDKYKPKL